MALTHLHLILVGMSLGLSAGILLGVARDRQLPRQVRALVAIMAFCGSAYSLTTAEAWADWGNGAGLVLRWIATLGVVALWQLVRVLFDDERGWAGFFAAAAIASAAVLANPLWRNLSGGMSLGITAVAGALVVHTLWMLLRGRAGDLDEGRRELRLWWLAAAGLYVLVVLSVHNLPWGGAGTVGHGVAQVSGQIMIKLCWLLMAAGHPSALETLSLPAASPAIGTRPYLTDRPVPEQAQATPSAAPAAEQLAFPSPSVPPSQALRRLQAERVCAAMKDDALYRQARLSLAELAAHVRIPEARLRLVIHDQLGFRHFNGFVNQFRLAEVAARLRNPGDAHLPILTLALEAGFGSIGPFNRAFREAYGVTPTEFRRGDGPPASARLAETSNPLAESLRPP